MEQTKKLNMTAMSDKTNSNTIAKKEEPAWEHKVAMKVSGVSIAVNLLLSLFKLLAGIVAHSGAMISDAIHSASDVGSTFVVIVGVNLSSKKSDKEHQYGQHRIRQTTGYRKTKLCHNFARTGGKRNRSSKGAGACDKESHPYQRRF